MPKYGYACKCGNEFTAHQTIEHRGTAQCPLCEQLADRDEAVEYAAPSTSVLIDRDKLAAGHWEHISYEGVNVSNRSELREVLKRTGKYAPGIFDSGH